MPGGSSSKICIKISNMNLRSQDKKRSFCNIRCCNMPHEVRPNELWRDIIQWQNNGVKIVWHEELRQCDTLWLYVPGTRNNCSCECVRKQVLTLLLPPYESACYITTCMYEIGLAGCSWECMCAIWCCPFCAPAIQAPLLQHSSCQRNRNLPLLKSLGRVPAAVLTHYKCV